MAVTARKSSLENNITKDFKEVNLINSKLIRSLSQIGAIFEAITFPVERLEVGNIRINTVMAVVIGAPGNTTTKEQVDDMITYYQHLVDLTEAVSTEIQLLQIIDTKWKLHKTFLMEHQFKDQYKSQSDWMLLMITDWIGFGQALDVRIQKLYLSQANCS